MLGSQSPSQRAAYRPALGGRQVLAGVRILFSRVIPLEKAPASHPLWLLAEAFGAQCTTEADAGVTHVVAGTRGTQKVFWALQSGKHVVLPAWCAPENNKTHSEHLGARPGRLARMTRRRSFGAAVRQARGAAGLGRS